MKFCKTNLLNFIIIFFLFVSNTLSGCSPSGFNTPDAALEPESPSESTSSNIKETEIVKIGINSNNAPWAYMQNETLNGFEADILHEIEKIMDVTFVYFPATNATVFNGLLQNKWDIAASSLLVDGKFDHGISFTEPYYQSGLALMVKEDSKINDFDLMQDGKFGAASGSEALAWLKTHEEQYGIYQILEYASAVMAIEDLVNLNLSGVIAEKSTLFHYTARNPGVRITAQMEETTPMAFAYRKGDLIGDRFNSAMQLLAANGTLAAIHEKWFGTAPDETNTLNLVYQESFGYPETYSIPDVIRVGIQTHNPPWEMIEQDHMIGFEVDILNEAASRMGIKLEYIPANANTIIPGLLANQWDIAASSIPITIANTNIVDFTGPYFDHDLALLTLSDSSIMEISHLGGGRYGVLTGSGAEKWLRNHTEEYGPYVVDEYTNLNTAISDLENEVISGVMSDSYRLLNYSANNDAVSVPLLFGDVTPVAFATRPSDYLCDVFNETINEMKEDGTLLEIYQQWFGEMILQESSTNTIYTKAYVPGK